MCEDLNSTKYLSLMLDTSLHKSLKLVSVLLRHFTTEKGTEIKIIDVQNVKGESSDHLSLLLRKSH